MMLKTEILSTNLNCIVLENITYISCMAMYSMYCLYLVEFSSSLIKRASKLRDEQVNRQTNIFQSKMSVFCSLLYTLCKGITSYNQQPCHICQHVQCRSDSLGSPYAKLPGGHLCNCFAFEFIMFFIRKKTQKIKKQITY